jgi:hypothetical protein
VTQEREEIGTGKACGTGPNDCNLPGVRIEKRLKIRNVVQGGVENISLEAVDGDRFIVLPSIAGRFARVKTGPTAHPREWVLSQEREERFINVALAQRVEKLRNGISRRAGFLTGGNHEGGLRLLESPFPRFDDLCASIRNGDDEFSGRIGIVFQGVFLSGAYIFTSS